MRKLPSSALLLLYTLASLSVPAAGDVNTKGVVNCVLEWHSGRQVFTYVFSGVVSSKGKPCPNARIHLEVMMPSGPDLIQETVASAEGTYEMKVTLTGNPDQSAEWKLIAQAPGASALDAASIEGRSILLESDEPVVVNRPIQLIEG